MSPILDHAIQVIPGYTRVMKTAISLPDELHHRVTRRAAELHMSRSEFFARAAERYLDALDAHSTTNEINDALERIGEGDGAADWAVAAGRETVFGPTEDW